MVTAIFPSQGWRICDFSQKRGISSKTGLLIFLSPFKFSKTWKDIYNYFAIPLFFNTHTGNADQAHEWIKWVRSQMKHYRERDLCTVFWKACKQAFILGGCLFEREPVGEKRSFGASTHLPLLLGLVGKQLRQRGQRRNLLDGSSHGTSSRPKTEKRRKRKRSFRAVSSPCRSG